MKDRRTTAGESVGRREAAETLAVAAFSFLAQEPEQLSRFLAISGLAPEHIREAARESGFLAGVLDHFSSDEALLLAFARHAGVEPTEIERARVALGGGWEHDLP